MIVVDIDPVVLRIGPLEVRWYGIMYIVGITVGLLVAWPYALSRGIPQAKMEKVEKRLASQGLTLVTQLREFHESFLRRHGIAF